MLANTRLGIPEMDAFDQDEIDNNPVLNAEEHVTLFGALLVAEGLITREQLKACLLLQAQDYPDTPIGQILVRCGYISADVIDQTLRLQTELKGSLIDSIDAQALRPADLTAVVLHRHGGNRVHAALHHLGVATTRVASWADFQEACREQQPDLILIDGEAIEATTILPERVAPPIFFIPPVALDDGQAELPECIRAQLMRFVEQARAMSTAGSA